MRNPGFILIEVMIALFLFGMTMYGGLGLYKEVRQHKKKMDTKERQEKILRSLASYALIYGRLPWASVQDAVGRERGLEMAGCFRGTLPFKTLGLQDADSKDGFGYDFTYVIAETRAAAISISPWETYCRALPVRPLLCEGYTFDDRKDFIIMALFSREETQDTFSLDGASTLWVTRNTLAACYGGLSCAPFHQPLPEARDGGAPVVRGYGR